MIGTLCRLVEIGPARSSWEWKPDVPLPTCTQGDEQLLAEMGRFNEELVKAGDSEVEIRQVFEADDFGAEFTPELRAQEERLRAEIASRSAT